MSGSTGSTGQEPSAVPFQPTQQLQPFTSARERNLYTFARQMMNRTLDDDDKNYAVLTSLDPANLLSMCQRSLKDYTVEQKDVSVRFTPLGFEQTIVLSFTPNGRGPAAPGAAGAATGAAAFSSSASASSASAGPSSASAAVPVGAAPIIALPPIALQILQCNSCEDAADAFSNYIGSFQRTWSDAIRRAQNRGLGDYAAETDNGIFFTELTAFTVLEILPMDAKMSFPHGASVDSRAMGLVRDLAYALDQTFQAERGRASGIRKAGLLPLSTSSIAVGQGTKLKLKFGPGAHTVKRLELEQPSPLMLGGDITVPTGEGDDGTQGELSLYGLKEGSATLTVQVAHSKSLHVETQQFTLNVGSSAPSSG